MSAHSVHSSIERYIAAAIRDAVLEERQACAKLAANPYSDPVAAIAGEEAFAIGKKIARAIHARTAVEAVEGVKE